jgi:hypothetical protein
MLRIRCPHCQSVLDIHASYAGQFIACAKCGKGMKVPAASPPKAAPPPLPPGAAAPRAPAPPARNDVQDATAAATSPTAQALKLPGSGTVTGEPDRLQDMPCDPLPPEAGPFVAALGQPICSIKTKSIAWAYYSGAACLAMGLFALIYAIIALAAQLGPMGGRIAPLVLGIVFLAGGVLSIVVARLEAQRVLWLCPGGLIWRVNGQTDHCRWQGVKQLHVLVAHVITTGAYHSRRLVYRYILTTESGFRMQLHSDEMSGTRTVGEFIQEQTAQALLPLYRQRLHNGEEIDFGAIRFDGRNFSFGGARLPWNRVGRIGVEEGYVVLGEGRDRLSVPMDQVSHVLILRKLAEEIGAAPGLR